MVIGLRLLRHQSVSRSRIPHLLMRQPEQRESGLVVPIQPAGVAAAAVVRASGQGAGGAARAVGGEGVPVLAGGLGAVVAGHALTNSLCCTGSATAHTSTRTQGVAA